MATALDDLAPRDTAAAINELLVTHGYPRDRVDSWWMDSAYEQLGGLTPLQAWQHGCYRKVWEMLRDAYAASEDAAKRLASDSQHAEMIERRIADLEARYGS